MNYTCFARKNLLTISSRNSVNVGWIWYVCFVVGENDMILMRDVLIFVVCFFRIGSKRWLQVFRSWNAVKWPCWPVGTFYWVNIKWCVEWNEMKFRFNVTDRVGMVWILMILVNYVMMMHGLWWCWWSLIYNVEKQWWYWWYINCKMV